MRKQLISFLLVLCAAAGTQAQYLVPLVSAPDRQKTDPKFAGFRESGQALPLPFFDDFAESDVQLNPLRWSQNGGAFLNNQFAIGQPSKNVVTFDGLKADGQPYNIQNTDITAVTDILTSRTIDLSGLNRDDSVYLSFAWQAGGIGNNPSVSNSYLAVQFMQANGNWSPNINSVIISNGTEGFQQKLYHVSSPAIGPLSFYHANFQFRFLSTGFQAGMGDIWNIDYVYLDKNRRHNDTVFYDVAATATPTSLLAPFSAVPLNHYLANPAHYTADTVVQEAANLHNVFRISQYLAQVKNRETGTTELLRDTIKDFDAFSRYKLYTDRTQNSVIDQAAGQRHLDYQFHIVSPSVNPEPYEYRHNDTIRRSNNLSNYFAYDDGSAESAYILLGGDQAAVRYDVLQPDSLMAIDFFFTPYNDNMQGSIIRVKVWPKGPDGKPDNNNVLFEEVLSIDYQGLNQFTRVYTGAIPVSGSFFVGWRQSFGNKHLVGIDLNSNSSQFRYFGNSSNNTWAPDIVETGSLMIRPVLGNVLSAAGQASADLVKVYPNPSNGIFRIAGEYDSVDLYDSNGRQISVQASSKGQVDLSGLPNGFYLMRAWYKGQFSTHKLMLGQ